MKAKLQLDYQKLYQVLSSTEKKDFGMFIGMVGMAYHQKQINYSSVKALLTSAFEKFDT